MQTFKSGAGLFAVDLGVPVVPAHIDGAHNILAKGKFMLRPGSVTVRFGEPIVFESNQFDFRWGRGRRRAAVELLEQRIRGLKRPSSPGDVARPSGEEQQATVSVAGVRTGSHSPNL
jgi:1-acyl-sn-glycerol-3-phosphate acyltransferase